MDARSRAGARPCAACTALRAGAQAQSRTADWAGHRSSNAAALEELEPTTDRQPRTVCTLQEGQSRIFACWVPRPVPGATLAWYLNGQKQEVNLSTADTASILTLTGQRSDHQLNCSLTIPTSSETYNTSVLLNVQYKPEILREDAHYQQVESTGLLLVLFVLVQANPPASITWVDEDGHVMANTSRFLRLGANHSLHIHLSCTAGNLSISAANSVGTTTASLLPTGLLDARVELPVLSVAIGAALALAALLSLGSCAACLACRLPQLVQGVEQAGGNSPPSQCSHCSRSEPPQPQGTRLPRQTRSLPPNLRLGDLAQEDGGKTLMCQCTETCGAPGPAWVRDRCPGSHSFASLQLPPRMQEPVLGEKKVPCWDWKTPWSSASLVRGAGGQAALKDVLWDMELRGCPNRQFVLQFFVLQVLSSSQCLGASTKCPARAVMRSGCELQGGASEPGLPGTR
ncbi:transmembrane protein 25 isoform X3 [Anomalospiza imberbis]|uniref:transmembrane protein 25 isoform X3 n=1 Tax=Anomalospiza imberbis TaxID=187417 RepID=UPI00358DFD28